MTAIRSHSSLVRCVALILIATFLPACTTWRTQYRHPSDVVQASHLKSLRLTRRDGSRVIVNNPTIMGDSLVGMRAGSSLAPHGNAWQSRWQRVAVSLDDIGLVEIREFDAGRTVALVVVGIGVAALAVATAQGQEPPPPPPRGEYVSCPLVYSWDGESWRLDSGTFGGAITQAAARTDVDNLLYAVPDAGRLRLRLANELNETDYVDALSVLVVDHDADVTIAPDGAGNVHTLGPLQSPLRASDFRGRDVLDRIASLDDVNWQSAPFGRNPDRAEDIRDGLELTFVRPAGATVGKLVVDGGNTTWASYMLTELIAAHGTSTDAWYDSLDTQPQFMQQFGSVAAYTGFLGVAVQTEAGWEHQGYIWEAGPEIAKRQVFLLNLERVSGDTVRVRLESAPSFWVIDQVALDYTTARPLAVHELNATRAIDHRGRDVGHLLAAIDSAEFVMETGDHAELEFDLPPATPGKTRSFVLRSTGWYRVHTAETETPQITLLRQVMSDRDAASRIAVTRMNEALRTLGAKLP